MEGHADKVENIFIEVTKKFSRFEKFESMANDVRKNAEDMKSTVEKIRISLNNYVSKDELKKIQDENDENSELLLKTVNDLKGDIAELHETMGNVNTDDIKNFAVRLEAFEKQSQTLQSQMRQLTDIRNDVYSLTLKMRNIIDIVKKSS